MPKHQMVITLVSTVYPDRPRIVIIDFNSLAGAEELLEYIKESQEPNNPFGIIGFTEMYAADEIS